MERCYVSHLFFTFDVTTIERIITITILGTVIYCITVTTHVKIREIGEVMS